jgi:hypothetical protein
VTTIAPPLGLTEKKAAVSKLASAKTYLRLSETVAAASSLALLSVTPTSVKVCSIVACLFSAGKNSSLSLSPLYPSCLRFSVTLVAKLAFLG